MECEIGHVIVCVLHPCLPPQLTKEAGSLPLTLPEMEEREKKSHLMYSLFLLALCVLVLWLFYSIETCCYCVVEYQRLWFTVGH